MKLLLAILITAIAAFGQVVDTAPRQVGPLVHLDDLPPAADWTGRSLTVDDCIQDDDCSTDGGTGHVVHTSNGVTWNNQLGGGSGGGSGALGLDLTMTDGTEVEISAGSVIWNGVLVRNYDATAFVQTPQGISSVTIGAITTLTITSTVNISTGDSYVITGFTGDCTGLNGAQTLTLINGTQVSVPVNTTGLTNCGSGTRVIGTNTSGTGTAVIYVTSAGDVVLITPSSLGVMYAPTGDGVVRQAASPVVERGGLLRGTVEHVAGAVDSISAEGTAHNGMNIQVGNGLTASGESGILLALDPAIVMDKGGTNVLTGVIDGVNGDIRVAGGTTVPVSCTGTSLFLDTDATSGQQLYACESGSYVLQGDGGGGGGTVTISEWFGAGYCNAAGGNRIDNWTIQTGVVSNIGCASIGGVSKPYITIGDTNTLDVRYQFPDGWDGSSAVTIRASFVEFDNGTGAGNWTLSGSAQCGAANSAYSTPSTPINVAAPSNYAQVNPLVTVALPGTCAAGELASLRLTFAQNGATGIARFYGGRVYVEGVTQ